MSNRFAFFESLESRHLMSVGVGLDGSTLKINGTLGSDTIKVLPDGGDICVNTDSDSAYEARYSASLVSYIVIMGDMGHDTINVYNTLTINAFIDGGMGDDTIGGGGGNDFLFGWSGNDVIDGDDGNDYLVGCSGDDRLEGDAGDDLIEGNAGKDTLLGDTGNDELDGGDGSDYLKGGDDSDRLTYDSSDWYVVFT